MPILRQGAPISGVAQRGQTTTRVANGLCGGRPAHGQAGRKIESPCGQAAGRRCPSTATASFALVPSLPPASKAVVSTAEGTRMQEIISAQAKSCNGRTVDAVSGVVATRSSLHLAPTRSAALKKAPYEDGCPAVTSSGVI